VQRQYTGTAGKITHCQLGVFLAYAGPKGRALIERELYLPRSWTGDGERLAAAKVPEKTPFATKPQLLQAMIERAITAGVPFGWVTADEAYGNNGPLRSFLSAVGVLSSRLILRAADPPAGTGDVWAALIKGVGSA